MNIEQIPTEQIIPYEKNPRHNEEAIKYVKNSIEKFGMKQPIVVDKNNVIVVGHTRLKACKELGYKTVPVIKADDLSPEQVKAYRLADNKTNEIAEWDFELLDEELSNILDIDMTELGFDMFGEETEEEKEEQKKLIDDFIIPPLSILDTRQGYWQDRKKQWKELGIKSELGRDENLLGFSEVVRAGLSGTSIFDPVLCEVIYKWFNIEKGSIYDCFAGGSVRGIVAEKLGYRYTGIDLRQEQIDANIENGNEIGVSPNWICDDSLNADKHLEDNSVDLVFSCPPYADLEVYSDDERDISNMEYDKFKEVYKQIIDISCRKLKENRFAVFVVGDVRDKKGFYRNFIDYTKFCFNQNGFMTYNEMILLEPASTAALRCRRNFANRKVTKTHQNVLVFYKGDVNEIQKNYKEIDVGDLTENNLILLEK